MIHLVEEVLFRRLDDRLLNYIRTGAEKGILKTTHQKIAEKLGSTRKVISRLLKDFDNRGMINQTRRTIEILQN